MAGWFKERKARSAAKKAQAKYVQDLAEWQGQHDHVENLLELANNIDAVQEMVREQGGSVRLKKGENVVLMIDGSGLVEPRVTGSHYEGGSRGTSIRVMKGVSFRVGSHKGTFVRGPEEQTIIDTGGTVYVTDQRVLYSSVDRNREWAWSKLIDIHHDSDATYMSVSNRQKTSGIVYGQGIAQDVQDRITMALALYDGEVDHLKADLEEQVRELDLKKPIAPPPVI